MHIKFHQPHMKDVEVIRQSRDSYYYHPFPFLLYKRL
jgi:hypothetical protein